MNWYIGTVDCNKCMDVIFLLSNRQPIEKTGLVSKLIFEKKTIEEVSIRLEKKNY